MLALGSRRRTRCAACGRSAQPSSASQRWMRA